MASDNQRIINDKVPINADSVSQFFEERAARFDQSHPLVSILYQDSNPALAEARDRHEKEVILPLLHLKASDRVLDIGCGIGRWADALRGKVARYHGTDLSAGLTGIAARRLADQPDFSFQALPAQENQPDRLECPPPFDLIIIAGVLAYINDDECRRVLANAAAGAGRPARIYLREPIGIQARLTLKNVWSEELRHEYSAIYRTVPELLEMIQTSIGQSGFRVDQNEPLLSGALANRRETSQQYFIIQRQ